MVVPALVRSSGENPIQPATNEAVWAVVSLVFVVLVVVALVYAATRLLNRLVGKPRG